MPKTLSIDDFVAKAPAQAVPSSSGAQQFSIDDFVTKKAPVAPVAPVPTEKVNPLLEVAKGVGKGVLSIPVEAAKMGNFVANQTAGRAANILSGRGNTATQGGLIPENEQMKQMNQNVDSFLESKNAWQTGGKVVEGIGEFFVPGLQVKKLNDARKLAQLPGQIKAMFTPKLGPTKYADEAASGATKPRSGINTPAMIDPEKYPDATRAMESVYDVSKALGRTADQVASPKRDVTTNINSLRSTIGEYSQKVISPFLSRNKVDVNFENFIDYMGNVKPPRSISSSNVDMEKFNYMRERIIESVYGSLKAYSKKTGDFGASTDMNDFWNARKVIDDIVEQETKGKAFTDPVVGSVNNAAAVLRKEVSGYISDAMRYPGQGEKVAIFRNTIQGMQERGMEFDESNIRMLAEQLGLKPTGAKLADEWDAMMKSTSGLYKGIEILSTKAASERTLGRAGQWAKDHPFIVNTGKAVGWTAGVGGAGAVGGAVLF